ncbi:MAG TPA: NUDIX domain-containing protein [Bacteroidales bacterium]|nr:NUDIX domain-containing protein [Bacteroidales bacterium]
MPNQVKIELLPPNKLNIKDLTYVVIGARENGKWIFVRHEERNTWELPAGHIESGESAEEAAHRELFEETGTTDAVLKLIHDYKVTVNEKIRFGRIFFAKILIRGSKPPSEIAEIKIAYKTPLPATYPEAHERFINILENYIAN